MKKRLITAALPYVNNIPHLGNLIQVLSADVFARFCRLKGYETLYVCGTDEYGTATETKSREEGITPKELCDRYHALHRDIYSWFNIAFDKFGRTSTPEQTRITQDLFLRLDEAGYINEHTIEQLYCSTCSMFLADRFVSGVCPKCGFDDARGDQCESCGKLLEPTDLKNPECRTCGNTPELRQTKHLYLDLPQVLPRLQKWIDETQDNGFWARNAVQMTKAWIRDGLKERCITRDLNWGIPVPKKGFEDKVFYVWFDAPIGYISITATHTDEWEKWWKDPGNVELFQFLGKDNIPFHTVVFPTTLLGSGQDWTMLHHMSSTEYMNYENTKFSKSKGIGVFGDDVMDTGIPADVWRFYIYYNRPEKSDTRFLWNDFQEKVNGELIGNFANLVNRSLTFIDRFYDAKLPEGPGDPEFWKTVTEYEKKITDCLERAELRDAFRHIFELSSFGNKTFQDAEPWRVRKEDPEKAGLLLKDLVYLVRDLCTLIQPYLPAASSTVAGFLGLDSLSWDMLGRAAGITAISKPDILFERLEDDNITALKERFSGTQDERKAREEQGPSLTDRFTGEVDLRVAKITGVERHPEADKLYVETIDVGGEERQIVSGLVPYYTEDELLGRNVILVYNLKPAKLRGVKSQGMLLAAEKDKKVEVLFVDEAAPGEKVVLEGASPGPQDKKRISINTFFEIPIKVENHIAVVEGKALVCGGEKVRCGFDEGTVG